MAIKYQDSHLCSGFLRRPFLEYTTSSFSNFIMFTLFNFCSLSLKYKSTISAVLQADRVASAILQAEGRAWESSAILQAGDWEWESPAMSQASILAKGLILSERSSKYTGSSTVILQPAAGSIWVAFISLIMSSVSAKDIALAISLRSTAATGGFLSDMVDDTVSAYNSSLFIPLVVSLSEISINIFSISMFDSIW